jgi:hypothetical protein
MVLAWLPVPVPGSLLKGLIGLITPGEKDDDDPDFDGAALEPALACFADVAPGAETAGDKSDSGDASSESLHAGFTAFSIKSADAPDKADLDGASFESLHAGFSGLSLETADTGEAAFAIKEAAKTAPAVSKAERLKLMFSPKAE